MWLDFDAKAQTLNGHRSFLNGVKKTEKSHGAYHDKMQDNAILLSQPGSRQCPITSFKLYMSKLTKLDAFLQQPNPYFKRPNKDFWYKAQPVGTIGRFHTTVSGLSGLNYIYTNHCIRGTTATGMKHKGHTLVEIAHALKHKNLESLKHYVPTLKHKENFSKSLFI